MNAGGQDLQSLPRMQRASWQARRLLWLLIALGATLILALLAGVFIRLFAADTLWTPLLYLLGAACLLLAGYVQWAWRIAQWRQLALAGAGLALSASAEPAAADTSLSAYDRLLNRVIGRGQRLVRRLGVSALWLIGACLLALWVLQSAWQLSLMPAVIGQSAYVVAGLGLVLAFGLLVLERHMAHADAQEWPEANGLALQLRVVLACLAIAVLCLFFAGPQSVWPLRLAVFAGVLPGLVAIELLLRAGFSMFNPQRPSLEPQIVADSLLAGLLQWPPRPLGRLQDQVHERFGIDLRQIWAFGFMRRALLPVLALMLLIGWGLSGVTQIAMNGRGVYERFGKPDQVYGPGLHLGLPWPFGQVRAVENGVIHELATSGEGNTASEELASTDGPAPISANRLWDATHQSEKSQVIASAANDKQSFQIVNMDIRFVYRIGLSDQAALAATYHSADIPSLIRSTASRVLVHQFAGRTLDDLLGEGRNGLSADIGKAVQADLDQLDSGVELLATVVEAIHPPAGAANAYHSVQAAQISAQALISRERGKASEALNDAQMQATDLTDAATAAHQETLGTARAAQLRFGAEEQAWRSAGQAFIDEQYFTQLALGMSHAHALILDHRLTGSQPPTIDLRSFAAPVDPAPTPTGVDRSAAGVAP